MYFFFLKKEEMEEDRWKLKKVLEFLKGNQKKKETEKQIGEIRERKGSQSLILSQAHFHVFHLSHNTKNKIKIK